MTALARNDIIQDTIQHWKHISSVIHEPQNADDYDRLSSLLDTLYLDRAISQDCRTVLCSLDKLYNHELGAEAKERASHHSDQIHSDSFIIT